MNKQEKLFALLLGLALAGWLFYTGQQSKKIQAARAAQAEAERKEEVAVPADTGISSAPAENTLYYSQFVTIVCVRSGRGERRFWLTGNSL